MTNGPAPSPEGAAPSAIYHSTEPRKGKSMMNEKHNEGPLVVKEGEYKTPTYSDEKCTKPTGVMTEKVQMVCLEEYGALAYCFNWFGNAKANATLYAAAPELLAACKYALSQLESAGIVCGDVRAAIAKATSR